MSNFDFHTQDDAFNGITLNQSLIDQEKSKRKDSLFFLAVSFFALLFMLVVIILNTYVFFIAEVSGASMYPTLEQDDKLITNRYKRPEVDDIITVKHQKEDGTYELWIKRVIAVGGDTVEIKGGYVYVNGQKKSEPYIENKAITFLRDDDGKVDKDKTLQYTLKEDEIYFLGDNRSVSNDARTTGPCKESDVVGVVEGWSLWLNSLKN